MTGNKVEDYPESWLSGRLNRMERFRTANAESWPRGLNTGRI